MYVPTATRIAHDYYSMFRSLAATTVAGGLIDDGL
jgi:hypothetical protein